MWSSSLITSLDTNELLSAKLENITTNTTFEDTSLARQLQTVVRLMETREDRGVDTDTFYVEIGGFDTHADVEENLSLRFIEVNGAIKSFVSELRFLNLFDQVTTIQASDFARTLNPNSGEGTDHAWGGNYMMFGGAVAGGKIVGNYPEHFVDSPLNVGRGRLIPTTPWDAVFSAVATWIGVPNSALDEVCPNIGNFDSSYLFDPNDLFLDIPQPTPTVSPTTSAPTDGPSEQPTLLTKSPAPSVSPSNSVSSYPSNSPSKSPSASPSDGGSSYPSNSPSKSPSASPSVGSTGAPSTSPSIPDPTCFDDESYRFNGKETSTCAFIGQKKEERCWKKDTITKQFAFEHCRASCDRCKCQNDDFYWEIPSQTCEDWVKLKKAKRCALSPLIQQNCKKYCKQECCMNNPDFRYEENPEYNCGWVGQSKRKRCNLQRVAYNCPVTCSKRMISGGCNYDPFA